MKLITKTNEFTTSFNKEYFDMQIINRYDDPTEYITGIKLDKADVVELI